MAVVNDREMEKIKREIEREFPDDIALQQVHLARKIISKEAKERGQSFFEYIQSLYQH
jgi:hypothetical protein